MNLTVADALRDLLCESSGIACATFPRFAMNRGISGGSVSSAALPRPVEGLCLLQGGALVDGLCPFPVEGSARFWVAHWSTGSARVQCGALVVGSARCQVVVCSDLGRLLKAYWRRRPQES